MNSAQAAAPVGSQPCTHADRMRERSLDRALRAAELRHLAESAARVDPSEAATLIDSADQLEREADQFWNLARTDEPVMYVESPRNPLAADRDSPMYFFELALDQALLCAASGRYCSTGIRSAEVESLLIAMAVSAQQLGEIYWGRFTGQIP